MDIIKSIKEINILIYILIILFGMSSWIDINGVWTELPLLVFSLPEGWDLPSYFILTIQVANIGPIAYTIGHKICPQKVKEVPVIYAIITVGFCSCVLLIFFWDETTSIGGSERSTALLTLTGLLALVDCTSSVAYLPYMAFFKLQYMSAFYIGEGFSALIPGLLGLAQGVGSDPICVNTSSHDDNKTTWSLQPEYEPARFSVEIFFTCITLLFCISGISFTVLHFAPYCEKAKVKSKTLYEVEDGKDNSGFETTDVSIASVEPINYRIGSKLNYDSVIDTTKTKMDAISKYDDNAGSVSSDSEVVIEKQMRMFNTLSVGQFALLMIYLTFVNAMTNGVLLSVLSYACLPYGASAYGYATRLSTIINPVACFFALFVPRVSVTATSILVAAGSALCAHILYLAAMSPTPPLQDEPSGAILVVLSYVSLVAIFSYVKVVIATSCRDDGGRVSLLWCGCVTQVGSFLGAVTIFICVNVYNLFESAPPCPE